MNSPFNALTVFTKFMSSPTDALEIISKIVSSPQDVLEFIKNLMDSPENAMDIMNKFMNTPVEALRILNNIFNGEGSNATTIPTLLKSTKSNPDLEQQSPIPRTLSNDVLANNQEKSSPSPSAYANEHTNVLMNSMLNYPSPSDLHANVLTPNTSSTSPMPKTPLTENESYLTPPSSAAESLNLSSSLEYDSSPIGLANAPSMTLHTTAAESLVANSEPTQLPILPTAASDPAADFTDDSFDIKSFTQPFFPDNIAGYPPHLRGDSINSLESVLTEVIRIEFQAFNNLPQESKIKQEQYNSYANTHHRQHSTDLEDTAARPTMEGNSSGLYGNNICIPGQQLLQCQPPVVCPPSTSLAAMSKDLNETELMKLRELKIASEALFLPVDDDLSVLMSDDRIKVRS